MSIKKSPEVVCTLCAKKFTAQGMGRHLCTCLEKNTSKVANPIAKKKGFLKRYLAGMLRASERFL